MREVLDRLAADIGGPESASDGNPSLAGVPPDLLALVRRLLDGSSPREALLNLGKVIDALPRARDWSPEPKAIDALATVLSSGPNLSNLLARSVARLDLLEDPELGQPWGAERLRASLHGALADVGADESADSWPLEQLTRAIAAFRNDQYVRLAACEFGLASLEQVGRELAELADVCVQAALVLATARHRGAPWSADVLAAQVSGIVAIAMGKHGSRELNFCSDIDLVFVYETDDEPVGSLSAHEYHSRVCRDVVKLLSGPTSEGVAFRVDLRLRPEGSRGPICNSLGSTERYYETWGGPYDRLAWLKSRVAGGDAQLGESMLEIMRPFVFPRSRSSEVIENIQQLSRRIRAELAGQRQLVEGWNVKLGEGGIRDIEFFVQALQLLHGGRSASLREPATLSVLERLLFAGLISGQERDLLAEAYELYRRIEHRLQLHGGRQTHLLPGSGPMREHVARHMGYLPAAFEDEVQRSRAAVSGIYATLGVDQSSNEDTVRLLEGCLADEQQEALLAQAGFSDLVRAREHLQLLTSKPWGPFAGNARGRLRQLAYSLLDEVSNSPDPDAALGHLVSMALRVAQLEGRWLMLADNEAATRLLCNLFGSSDLLARLFIEQPELLDQLLLAGRATELRSADEMREEIERRVEGADVEDCFGALEQYRNEEVLRIGLHDIAGGLSLEAVWGQLSDLAEQILDRLYRLVYAEAVKRYGRPRTADGAEATMTVVGLGKLGGREMSYGSDLDLIFVHSGEGQTDGARSVYNGEFFAKVAQRLIRALTSAFVHGKLYEVDTRLRPSGSQGTLVSSLAAFERYHAESAQIWERQVLTKARPVAGDPAFRREVGQRLDAYVYGAPLKPEAVRGEIVRLRGRMEHELGGAEGATINIKQGRGGLMDVEFVAQYLQLCFGARTEGLRSQSTLEVLSGAQEAGLLEDSTAETLVSGYRFLRRLEGRLRIVRGRSSERLPATEERAEQVARRLDYRKQGEASAGRQLLQEYHEVTEAVRRAFEQVFTTPPPPGA